MKKWILRKQPKKSYFEKFGSNYSKFITTILYQRGIKNKKEALKFFDLDFENGVHDPFLLSGMKEAVKRIKKALENKEKIAIFGDYDADGVTASSVVYAFFRELKIKPIIYIPDRIKEGYGLNEKAIAYLKEKKVDLVITVDTGVRNVAEVKMFKKEGMEVVVTDHHEPPGVLPKAKALVNPHLDKGKYPCEFLAGVGVAYKLVQALIREFGEDKFSKGFNKWILDLVAIGTIADLVPLMDENRVLAKYGLIVLGKTQRKGLRALMKRAGIDLDNGPIRSEQVAFYLAPRINAAGRMDHANSALVLLNETDENKIEKLADDLEKQNKNRQELTNRIFEDVLSKDFGGDNIIIDGSKDWPLGVVGLVSGKLCEKYSKPVLIFMQEKGRIRGSARSIPGFNVVKALDEVSDLIFEYGGHSQAAGFTVLNENVKEFSKRLKKIAKEKIKKEDMVPRVEVDYKIKPIEINYDIMDDIKALEPFGAANNEPVFWLENVYITTLRMVGNEGKHLKMRVCDDKDSMNGGFNCIGFNFLETSKNLNEGDKIDLLFNLFVNTFNGRQSLEFRLIDIWKK